MASFDADVFRFALQVRFPAALDVVVSSVTSGSVVVATKIIFATNQPSATITGAIISGTSPSVMTTSWFSNLFAVETVTAPVTANVLIIAPSPPPPSPPPSPPPYPPPLPPP